MASAMTNFEVLSFVEMFVLALEILEAFTRIKLEVLSSIGMFILVLRIQVFVAFRAYQVT